ncbi:solute carrier family 66 member 3 [Bacillus rossius redtenbacheri]|uniref:solute carrier family 66 member 3 n=1 Tax=Bacillus rossius redtenbacheri TaxID=93214 RepID=UPI002FDD5181
MGVLHIISDVLSVITIALCFILKIPQILNIIKLKSAKGISLKALLLELSSYTVMTCYNYTNGYALLTYMEYPVIISQQAVLILLVSRHSGLLGGRCAVLCALYLAVTCCFLSGVLPKAVLAGLVPLCTPVSAFSKVMQLYEIVSSKNAESVSLLTWFLSAFTNLTRIYTIYLDSADPMLLTNFSISVALSSSVLAAAAYYRRPKAD